VQQHFIGEVGKFINFLVPVSSGCYDICTEKFLNWLILHRVVQEIKRVVTVFLNYSVVMRIDCNPLQ